MHPRKSKHLISPSPFTATYHQYIQNINFSLSLYLPNIALTSPPFSSLPLFLFSLSTFWMNYPSNFLISLHHSPPPRTSIILQITVKVSLLDANLMLRPCLKSSLALQHTQEILQRGIPTKPSTSWLQTTSPAPCPIISHRPWALQKINKSSTKNPSIDSGI